MIDELTQEQAALFVAGALPEEEARAFEQKVNSDETLRKFVGELQEGTTIIVDSLPPVKPAAKTKEAIMSQIAPPKSEPSAQPEPAQIIPIRSSWSWIPWAAAAMFAVTAGTLLIERFDMRKMLLQAENDASLAQLELQVLKATKDGPQQAMAMVAWNESTQSGVIKVSQLPAPLPGRDYQLWVIDPAEKLPVAAGILRAGAGGTAEVQFKPTRAIRQASNFAISVEKAGGSPTNEGPIVMIGGTTL